MDDNDAVIAAMLGRPMVGKYLVVAEAYDDEGERSLIVRPSPDMSIWDERGLLACASTRAELADQESWRVGGWREEDD